MNIAIYTLTSELHDAKAVSAVTHEFLESLHTAHDFKDNDYSDYGTHTLDLIYVRTGGTEGIFRRLLPQLISRSNRPFYLLTSGKSNSLAASMEILSYLRKKSLRGEIIHGDAVYIARRIRVLLQTAKARETLESCRLGIVGEPSDWLIASHADRNRVKNLLGIELVDIPMKELLNGIKQTDAVECDSAEDAALTAAACQATEAVRTSLPGALRIYHALQDIVARHHLQGFTLRCFDLLTAVHNTGCLALARLNAEGYVAGCEGDVPAMLSMEIAHALLGVSGFLSNPARIDPETGEIVFAHCTIPLNLVERYELDTHFESGIGVGIRGYMTEGPVTIFKLSGDMSRHFVAEGQLLQSQSKPDLCRTQLVIRLNDPAQASYFLTNPIGNHHIILPGHHKALLEELLQ